MAKWIQKAVSKMKEKGTVGSFSAAAKKAGKSTAQETASVLKAGSHASGAMKKKAQFAKNMRSIHGGKDEISTSSMKGHELSSDRASNLKAKEEFTAGCNCEHGEWCDCK
jgi:hypothetical protein